MTAGFVTVYETTDSIQAEMLADVLVQEGLDARLLGTRNAPLLGVGQSIIRLRIEVPEHQVAAAAAVVEAWETAPPLADDADVGAGEDHVAAGAGAAYEDAAAAAAYERAAGEAAAAGEAEGDRPRVSPILAGGVAFLLPGAAHFYTRRPWTGACLAAGMVMAMIGLGGDRVEASAAAIGLLGLVVYDIVGGQFAARAFNRGVRPSFWRQLALGAGALVVVGGVAVIVAPRLPQRRARAPLYESDAQQQHEMLRLRLEEMEKDQRIHSFPFPVAPLAGESAPSGN